MKNLIIANVRFGSVAVAYDAICCMSAIGRIADVSSIDFYYSQQSATGHKRSLDDYL